MTSGNLFHSSAVAIKDLSPYVFNLVMGTFKSLIYQTEVEVDFSF